MRHPRLLMLLLLLATVLVDAAVCGPAGSYGATCPPWIVIVTAWALQLSQVSLTATWLGLGSTAIALRLVGALLVVAGWSTVMAAVWPGIPADVWGRLLMAQTCVIGLPLLALRWVGLRLVDSTVDSAGAPQPRDLARDRPRLQFSIRYLFGCMTAMAVVLAALHYAFPSEPTDLRITAPWISVVFVGGRGAVALTAMWAILGNRWPVLRFLAFAVSALLACLLNQLAFEDLYWDLVRLCCLEAALLSVMLAVVRIAGYRLHLRRFLALAVTASAACLLFQLALDGLYWDLVRLSGLEALLLLAMLAVVRIAGYRLQLRRNK